MTIWVNAQNDILNEEWPQKGTRGAKKEKSYLAIFFAPFAPFCGQTRFPSARGRLEFSDQNDE
jgi:hypothetical protein